MADGDRVPANLWLSGFRPPAYACLYPILVVEARKHGYALGLHGSMARDLDVIAVPWTDEASAPDALVASFVDVLGAHVSGDTPRPKPHGRICWSLMMDGGFYVDLSVVPRAPAAKEDDRG